MVGPTPLVPKPQASRYRRGKLPSGAPAPSDSDSDSESDQDGLEARVQQKRKNAAQAADQSGLVAGGAGRVVNIGRPEVKPRNIQVALRDVKVEDDGAVLIGGKRQGETAQGEWDHSNH